MKTIQTDGLVVTQDEALEHCIHHLRLAALFFEAGPDPLADWETEFKRICTQGKEHSGRAYPPELKAGLTFLRTIHATYEEMKSRD